MAYKTSCNTIFLFSDENIYKHNIISGLIEHFYECWIIASCDHRSLINLFRFQPTRRDSKNIEIMYNLGFLECCKVNFHERKITHYWLLSLHQVKNIIFFDSKKQRKQFLSFWKCIFLISVSKNFATFKKYISWPWMIFFSISFIRKYKNLRLLRNMLVLKVTDARIIQNLLNKLTVTTWYSNGFVWWGFFMYQLKRCDQWKCVLVFCSF